MKAKKDRQKKSIYKTVKEFVLAWEGNEEITPQLLRRQLGISKESSWVYIHRLKKEGILEEKKDKHGYREYIKKKPISEKIKEIIPTDEKIDLKNIRIHHLTLVLSKENIEKLKEKPYKIGYTLPPLFPSKTHETQDTQTQDTQLQQNKKIEQGIEIEKLFIPMNRQNLFHAWRGATQYNPQNKSYSEKICFGEKRHIIIHLYGNGNVVIYIEASENPLDEIGFAELRGFLKNLFSERCGYNFNDLEKLFVVKQIELNDDIITNEKVSMNITDCITFKEFGEIYRIYKKRIGNKDVIRSEIVANPDMPLSNFWEQFLAFKTGGVNYSMTVTSLHILIEEMKKMKKLFEELVTVNQFYLKRLDTSISQLSGGHPMPELLDRVLKELDEFKAIKQEIMKIEQKNKKRQEKNSEESDFCEKQKTIDTD